MSDTRRYPLGEHDADGIKSGTGRPLSELTIDAIRSGQVNAVDMCIHPETLRAQADIAEDAGYDQLATNLRRAAELTGVPQSEILSIYEALRPYRVSYDQLLALADRLKREYGATENARLIREAAEVYRARGLV